MMINRTKQLNEMSSLSCSHSFYLFKVNLPDATYSNIGKVSYDDAKAFCVNQGKNLCSYDSYCPDGELSQPLRGKGAGEDVWAAIGDLENDWVQISDARLCQRHSVLYGPPTWDSGCCNNNEVLCCDVETNIAGKFGYF